ncbi:uncharacterized protein [Nicotiana sylvestris]|uniref:uncharacterized protein n=1 Tax=Nicotiana sylvestris TaxID=4096 RepID=UPI00388CBE81
MSTNTCQVKLAPSKLDVLVSTIDVAPLEIVPPASDKLRVEESDVEIDIATHEKKESENEGESSEKKSENEGKSGEEKESEEEEKLDEQVGDFGEEEKYSEEEGDSESEGEDVENGSASEGEYEESEKENKSASGESKGSMAIANTVIALLEEASRKKRC